MAPLTEDQIRNLVRVAREKLGSAASRARVQDVVRQAVELLEREGPRSFQPEPEGRILVICISASETPVSGVLSQALSGTGCRIVERFERKLANFNVLLAVIERNTSGEDFATIRRKLGEAGNAIGVRIILQTEDTLKRR